MDIRIEAMHLLRDAFKQGATIGRLVDLVVNLYQQRSEPLSHLEFEKCFELAFDLNIGLYPYLTALREGRLAENRAGDATVALFRELWSTREIWDTDLRKVGERCWLDTLPSSTSFDHAAYDHPHIPEWESLSRGSQKYIVRLAMSGALQALSARFLACLAERLQSQIPLDLRNPL